MHSIFSIVISILFRITLPEVIEKVQILFQGNTALLTAFGSFLPERTQVADQHSNQFQDSEMEYYNPPNPHLDLRNTMFNAFYLVFLPMVERPIESLLDYLQNNSME